MSCRFRAAQPDVAVFQARTPGLCSAATRPAVLREDDRMHACGIFCLQLKPSRPTPKTFGNALHKRYGSIAEAVDADHAVQC